MARQPSRTGNAAVVRERIIIRKHTVTETERVQAELRLERIDIETDPAMAHRVHDRIRR